jgi:DNA ligase-associated metallophosphoesterase
MIETLECQVAGERLELFATRALHWPRAGALLIADLHLGKAATFRAAGIALPRGSTEHDLMRLGATLGQCAAERLIVLGDFLHGASRNEHWQRQWHQWRAQHASLAVQVIGGNHDHSLRRLELGIDYLGTACTEAPFELRHAPGADAAGHVLCGHLHPVVRLPGIPGRWPAFVLGTHQTVLPAFSEFTGGVEVAVTESQLAVCVADSIALIRTSRDGERQRP